MRDLSAVLKSIQATETEQQFRTIRCKEKDLIPSKLVNGFVYFTTDTKKIYLGYQNQYLMMGGASGIFYGKRQLTDDEKYGEDILFEFSPDDIDGTDLPAIDDLILNIPDGGFYRVLDVSPSIIEAQRLMIAGTGGGTGGGPGGSTAGSIGFTFKSKQYDSTLIDVDYYIEYELKVLDSDGNIIRDEGTAVYKVNGEIVATEKVKHGLNSYNIGPKLNAAIKTNEITVTITMDTGGATPSIISRKWYIDPIALALQWPWTYGYDEYRKGSTFTLTVRPSGNRACTLHVVFDNDYTENVTYFTHEIDALEAIGTDWTTPAMPSLSYGAHTCEIYLTSPDTPLPTPTIKREITFVYNGNSTILTVPFYETTVTQYQSVNIPFLVYNPASDKCAVSFYVNDIKISTNEYDRTLQSWPYTPTETGITRLVIATEDKEDSKEFVLQVDELKLNVKEAGGYAFSLKANNFSSNEQLRDWKYDNTDEHVLEFSSNFDWNKGGLHFDILPDGNIEKYILVRQGTQMTINYNLFEKFTTGISGGKNFKFCFKTANCYDYAAPVLECYANGIGVKVDAQKAIFENGAVKGFNTQFRENTYVELETEIWPDVPNIDTYLPGDRFMMFWVDGIPTGVQTYSYQQSFTQTTPQKIIIGSTDCDVYVYVVKAYERKLSTEEHMGNFILDAPSVNKMIDRYNRNNILDTTGEISYEKLVAANPECRAYIYEIPQMTKHKKDKVKGCKYYELWREYNTLAKPYYKSSNATTYVQGTSSAAYGVAAFNLRSEFEDLTDKDGNAVDGWKVTENAIPIDVICSKVNVASCENVNNAVNQEWYNRFQPYHDAHRRKATIDGKAYRDTMQFESGVMFIKDNNTVTNYYKDGKPDSSEYLNANIFFDTTSANGVNYTKNPYYKQYAICNVGNDKKNTNVFHDESNDLAMCIEIKDNNNPQHWMTTKIYDDNWTMEEPYHEFRYPDGNDKAKDYHKQCWMAFNEWMVNSNPNAGNESHILKAIAIPDMTADKYKKNVYFIKNADNYYEKAIADFNETETYYNISAGVEQDGDERINVIFDNYTYRGFDPPGYEGQENPTGISLKGVVETTFGTTKTTTEPKRDSDGNIEMDASGNVIMETRTEIKPYTHDTYNYRMAKMLSECEDHLVMDSVVYHYLFIQRHTMVDNVAKNTFWSTEDGIHWDLTKNYDNDTADGNNNTGYLTFTYGLECLDKINGNEDVFNASPSVWFNFVHGLKRAQKDLYEKLEAKKAWSASEYLAECKRHQDKIPERCWIEDYMRKYIRPYRLGLDDDKYLKRLEGGKKTHQRDAFETYQEFYLNSKYIVGNAFNQSTAIDMRLNNLADTWDTSYVMPVTFYIDCYGSLLLGGRTIQSERLKRGDVWDIPVGSSIGNPNDATCYIYGSSMIQTLDNLDKVYPKYIKLIDSRKLRELSVGSSEDGYYNSNLESLTLNNPMLQKVQAQQCGISKGIPEIDLSNAIQLESLLVDGSKINSVKLADGCPITELKLNALTQLTVSNLDKLEAENLSFDDGINNSIENLYVQNCPAFDHYTYQMARNSESLTKYQLIDFNWVIDGTEDDYQLTNDFVIDEDNKVISIKALDNLCDDNTNPKDDLTDATALKGNLKIDVDCNIDEYEIYNKYVKTFPNLTIEYTDNVVNCDRAVELKFYVNQDETAVHYRVLGSGNADGDNVATLISKNGPLGIAMSIPHKEDSTSQTFKFTGYWIDKNNPTIKYYDDTYYTLPDTQDGFTITKFSTLVPEENMEFYPEYNIATRQYLVRFYDWNNEIILQNGEESFSVDYNTVYNGPMTEFYYRSSADLPDDKRYTFIGWSKRPPKGVMTSIPEGDRVYLNSSKITNNINLYACYSEEDVHEMPTNMEYFDISIVDGKQVISLKKKYQNTLEGKITLPSNANNKPIVAIAEQGFYRAPKITHIFFLVDNTSYETIGKRAFAQCEELQYIELPNNLTLIDDNAFAHCIKLTTVKFNEQLKTIGAFTFSGDDRNNSTDPVDSSPMSLIISKLPDSIETINGHAFYMGGPNITITALPKKLYTLGINSFHSCPNVCITQLGSNDGNSVLHIVSQEALQNAGNNCKDNVTVHIYSSVECIGRSAFLNYLSSNAKFIFYNTLDKENNPPNIYYYADDKKVSTQLSSPDGQGAIADGTIVSMGCPAGSFALYDPTEQTYVEVV